MKKKYKNKKKKYVMKKDSGYYQNLSGEFEKQQMSDYSFKKRSDIEGKNTARMRRNEILKIILSVIGAFVIISIGYFIVATVRNVNSYHPQSTACLAAASESGFELTAARRGVGL